MTRTIGTHAGNVKTMCDFNEAVLLVQQLDHAAEIPLYFKLPDHMHPDGKPYVVSSMANGQSIEIEPGYHAVPHNKGVINLRTGTLAAVTGMDYSVLQHGDGLGVAMNTIQSLGMNALYAIENDGNVARMEVLFPEISVQDDTQEGVLLGVRMSNSYDKSTGFRGELFGFRQWCANGCYSKRILGEVNINARHVGANFETLEKDVLKFVKHVIDSPQVVQSVITTAIEAKLEFLDNQQVYDTVFAHTGNMKQAEKIAAEIPLKTNRWTLYNAFTRYLSHEDVTHKTRDTLAEKAEKILLDERFAPLVVKDHAPRSKVA